MDAVSEAQAALPEHFPLMSLPNEVVVRILLLLDPCSRLNMRASCRHFRLFSSDPICWPKSLSWEGNNQIKDIDRLQLVLRLSKSVLKRFCLSCPGYSYPFSQFISLIQASHHLESVSLVNVNYTIAQIVKLLHLPLLTYLHVDISEKLSGVKLIKMASSDSNLKTLSITEFSTSQVILFQCIKTWVAQKCTPPNLNLTSSIRMFEFFVIEPDIEIEHVLGFHPSIQHNACLSLYDVALKSFSFDHPYYQLHFTPNPSMPVVEWTDMEELPLIVTTEMVGCSKVLGAVYNSEIPRERNNSTLSKSVLQQVSKVRYMRVNHDFTFLQKMSLLYPNLVHLDLCHSKQVWLDLEGFRAVATQCPKLRILTLFRYERKGVKLDDLRTLWEILKSMASLRALFVPTFMIDAEYASEPVAMPQLTSLHICGHNRERHIENVFNFLSNMPSLEVFRCDKLPPVSLCRGMSLFLHASPKLRHFYLSKLSGNKLTLPTDPACYRHLQTFFLECHDFVIHDDMVRTLARSENLSLIVLRIGLISVKGIVELLNSLKSLCLLHIHTSGFAEGFSSQAKATSLAKTLKGKARQDGRCLDLKIQIGQDFVETETMQCPELFRWRHSLDSGWKLLQL